MISNGSIDFNSFSNMSNQQRRDSILKIINDQNSLRVKEVHQINQEILMLVYERYI